MTEKPGSFSSPDKLLKSIKKDNPNTTISQSKIKKYLKGKSEYFIHKPVYKKIRRNKIVVAKSFEIIAVDLMNVSNIAKHNDGVNYILLGIDMFSRVVYATQMETKTGHETTQAFKKIFRHKTFRSIYADMGGEFKAKLLKNYLDTIDTHIYYATNYVKASMIERFIRTLRLKLERFMESRDSYRYIDNLQDLITSYNRTYHRSIGRSPASVNETNTSEVFQYQYLPFPKEKKKKDTPKTEPKEKEEEGKVIVKEKKMYKRARRFKFKIDDYVRVSDLKKSPFQKEARASKWSEEIFKITQRRIRGDIPIYKLRDLKDEDITGTWYESELYPATYDSNIFSRLDKQHKVKTRRRNKKTEFYVKFRGYPKKFNTWLSEREYRKLVPKTKKKKKKHA